MARGDRHNQQNSPKITPVKTKDANSRASKAFGRDQRTNNQRASDAFGGRKK